MPLLVPFFTLGSADPETWGHLAATVLPRYVVNTLLYSLGTALLAGAIGVATAWVVSQYEFPGRRMVRAALVLPLALPLYVSALAFAGLFEYTGALNTAWVWLRSVTVDVAGATVGNGPAQRVAPGSADATARARFYLSIRNLPGLIVVSSFALYPYVYLTMRNWFESQAARILEAGRSLADEPRVLRRLAVPIARPALIGGAILVVMETLNAYGAPLYFGVSTLTTGIFRTWFSLADVQAALRLSGMLLALVVVLLVTERLSRRNARYAPEAPSHAAVARRRTAGGSAVLCVGITALPIVIGFVAPVARLIGWTVYAEPALWHRLLPVALRTVGVAAVATSAIMLVGVAAAHSGRMLSPRVESSLTSVATVGYAIPGAVIAIGMMQFAGVLGRLIAGIALIGTTLLLITAYGVRFLGVGFHPTRAAFELTGARARESARALGCGSLGALVRVELPMIARVLGGAALLVFVDVVKELPLTLILRPFSFATLATETFRLAGSERLVEASVPGLALVGVGCLAVFVLERVFGGTRGR